MTRLESTLTQTPGALAIEHGRKEKKRNEEQRIDEALERSRAILGAMQTRRRQREAMALTETPNDEDGIVDLEGGGELVQDSALKDDILLGPGRPSGSAWALMRSPKPGDDQVHDEEQCEDIRGEDGNSSSKGSSLMNWSSNQGRRTWWFSWLLLLVHVGRDAVATGASLWILLNLVWAIVWWKHGKDDDREEDDDDEDDEEKAQEESDEEETVLFHAEDDLIPLNPVERQPRRIAQGLLIDTGAGVTIANGGESFPELELEAPQGSKLGQQYA